MAGDGLRDRPRNLVEPGLGDVAQELQREMDSLRSNGAQSFDSGLPKPESTDAERPWGWNKG